MNPYRNPSTFNTLCWTCGGTGVLITQRGICQEWKVCPHCYGFQISQNKNLTYRQKEPCTACPCSGVYVDYGGPAIGGIAVSCKFCNGKGWTE